MHLNKYFFILFFSSYLLPQIPYQFHLLDSNKLYRYDNISEKGQTAHNAIIDIRPLNDSLYFFGTAKGLSYAEIIQKDSIDFGYFTTTNMPRGGNPAIAILNNSIAVSGVIDTSVVTGNEPKGTGIAFSTDFGNTWTFLNQPLDTVLEGQLYHTITWGGQNILALTVTTEINNVSYDLAIHNDYIYAASWAGGLRRYPIGIISTDQERKWEIIPLPRDRDLDLYCGEIDTTEYYINPRDPSDNGFHNHKGFSVYVYNNIIWVGTAAGINKGIINGNCINWSNHYSSLYNNISGNWVIGFTHQTFNAFTRIWAITWNADSKGEFSALSYSDDNGETWKITQPAGYPEKVYNLYANSNRIWAASKSGLFVSNDGQYWEKYNQPFDIVSGEKLFSETILSTFYSEFFNSLWLGNNDGIATSNNDGNNWAIHRFWEKTIFNNHKKLFNAYPNPFLINEHNIYQNSGHVRFIFSNPNYKPNKIDIFDFSMNKVIELNNSYMVNNIEGEVIWDGRNEYGDKVHNGVYFCRLSINNKFYWTKLAIIN